MKKLTVADLAGFALVTAGLFALGCTDDVTEVVTDTGTEDTATGDTETDTDDEVGTDTDDTDTDTTDTDDTETESTDTESTDTETETSCEGEGCPCETEDDCPPEFACIDNVCTALDPVCGNGVLEGDEECDDGEDNSETGACMPDCTLQVCGNGLVGPPEECDDANDVDTDDCTNACTAAACGDGVVWEGNEICDDGNGVQGDGCNNDCILSGTPLDTTEIDGGQGNDFAFGVAYDSVGNYVIAGRLFVTGQSCDIWVGKFAPDGTELWTDTLNGGANGCDYARAVAIDDEDNVAVAGTIDQGGAMGRDIWVRKYTPAGEEIWTQTHHQDDGSAHDFAFGVGVDGFGNVYAVGWVTEAGQGENAWVGKFSGIAGTPIWTHTYNGPGNGIDYARAVAVHDDGSFVITGRQYVDDLDDATANYDLFIRKYNSNSSLQWARTYDGTDNVLTNLDEGWGVDLDANHNVVIAGYTDTLDEAYDFFVRKYNSLGVHQWTNIYSGPDQLSEHGRAAAFGPDGSIVVTGSAYQVGNPNHRDLWTRKYDGDGAVLWTQTYDEGNFGDDESWGVDVDANGQIIIVGNVTTAGDKRIIVRKYAP